MSEAWVEVWRGGLIESRHRVHVAVVDGEGRVRARAGDADLVTYARSTLKPMQALPLLLEGVAERFEMRSLELAICCASHSGEPRHVEVVRGMLKRIGAAESDLACGAHAPFHEPSARALRESGVSPGRVHNNCSGKHAGMLALATSHGWPRAGYHRVEHPVQKRVLEEVAAWAEAPADEIALAVDGCGVITFGLPLSVLAGAFARLASSARRGEAAPRRIVQAMLAHPDYVAGTDRAATEVMRVSGGRIFAKDGAEGLYCAGIPGAELGIALKVEDGAMRAAEPALVGVLQSLGLLTAEEAAALDRFGEPEVTNTRGERTGRLCAKIALEPMHG